MTALSAPQRASETPSNPPANPFLRDRVASLRTVQVPGTPATCANRAMLKEIGLRWDPEGHRWHGTASMERVRELRERLGLEVRCFGDLDAAPKGPTAPKPAPPSGPAPGPSPIAFPTRDPTRRIHDGSRTCVEARVVLPGGDEDESAEEIRTPTRRFTIEEITSGLPDDSREADEERSERRLREPRSRVKLARAVVATAPGVAELIARDSKKAAYFYEKFGTSERQFRHGATAELDNEFEEVSPKGVTLHRVADELRARKVGVLPGYESPDRFLIYLGDC